MHISNSGRVSIESTVILHNHARLGGGASFVGQSNTSSGVEMSNCLVTDNHARNAGGGLAVGNNLRLHDSVFTNNRVLSDSEGGGGIYIYANKAFVNLENSAGLGAGVCVNAPGTVVEVVNTVMKKNSAFLINVNDAVLTDVATGGGMFISGHEFSVSLTHCLFSHNTGSSGGAVGFGSTAVPLSLLGTTIRIEKSVFPRHDTDWKVM